MTCICSIRRLHNSTLLAKLLTVQIIISDDKKSKATKALKPSRKPKEDPGLLMKNLAMKLHSARQRKNNGY